MLRRSTISDVARLAGVSVGTASNVLNEKGRYAEATRRRVLWAASQTNYAPNALIRSLQSGRTNTIGVFTWRMHLGAGRDVSLAMLRALSRGLSQYGLDALLYARHPHEGDVAPAYFLDGRVDGAILAPGGLTAEGATALASSGMPAVMLYQRVVPSEFGSVTIDNQSGVLSAVDHLVGLGHRRIAFVSTLYSDDFRERLEAYQSGLERHGIVPERRWVSTSVSAASASLEQAVMQMLRVADPPTAIIAGNDGFALNILDMLLRYGIRVPEDLSLVGFDDAPDAESARLTTVRQPAEEVGFQAALMMGRMIEGGSGFERHVHLPVSLIPRDTTGPRA